MWQKEGAKDSGGRAELGAECVPVQGILPEDPYPTAQWKAPLGGLGALETLIPPLRQVWT